MSVNSYVLVRVFHLGSWGGPLLFREPAELQSESPVEAAAPPSQLFHCLSALDIEEQPTPPSLTLLLVGRAVVASSALPEGSSQVLVSGKKPFGIFPYIYEYVNLCVYIHYLYRIPIDLYLLLVVVI